MIPNGHLVLKLKEGNSIDGIRALVEDKFQIVDFSSEVYTIRIFDFNRILEIANKVYESGVVEFCHPDFIVPLTKLTVDPLYNDQFYLNNTGQLGGTSGIDINAPEAWAISRGLNNIRVAVFDDGVENHEDIDGRVAQGFTATDVNGFGVPGALSEHGQACAGIIAATHDNSLGIAGVAPCTTIVPVRILGVNATVNQIAAAYNWARNQADVLSNSWAFTDNFTEFDVVTNAITNARTLGRSGRGCIVVFSSGNSQATFNGVTYPARVPGVVTVGAIQNTGAIWNYSSRGAQMELVAPSGNVNNTGNIRTTDRTGANGYATGNYVNTFGGTSAACPQVAGVAALMLSVNPLLTEAQVSTILNNTATDMGSTGFDNTYGHGRLNAVEALRAALPTVNGSASFCTTATYTIAAPGGTIVNWSVTPASAATFPAGVALNKTFTANATYRGNATISATVVGGCSSLVLTRQVYIGRPLTYAPAVQTICTNLRDGNDYTLPASPGATSYQLISSSNNLRMNGTTNLTFTTAPRLINFRATVAGNYTVTINTTNACGTSTATFPVVAQFCSTGGRSSFLYAIYPNPASSEIFISYDEEITENGFKTNSVTENESIRTELYDFGGNLVRAVNFGKSENIPSIDISDLKKVNYFLRIAAKETDEVHQIIKE